MPYDNNKINTGYRPLNEGYRPFSSSTTKVMDGYSPKSKDSSVSYPKPPEGASSGVTSTNSTNSNK
jgi:hypothetical protein